jgi:hypothetical protein
LWKKSLRTTLLIFSSSHGSNPCDELLHIFSALVVEVICVTNYSTFSFSFSALVVEVARLMNYSTPLIFQL